MPFTLAQQTTLAVLPKVTGFSSMMFSALIIYSVLSDAVKRRKTYHRLLVGISLVDISSSFWLGLSTWPIPEDSGILWASGNDQTCNVQGFFTQFGIGSSFYNASLSIYFLLVIRHGWRPDRIKRLEPILHLIPIAWALGTAIAALSLGILGNSFLWCFITADNDIYRWAFFYGPLWLMILIVTGNVLLILRYVWQIEKSSEMYRYRRDPSSGRMEDSSSLSFGNPSSTSSLTLSTAHPEQDPRNVNNTNQKQRLPSRMSFSIGRRRSSVGAGAAINLRRSREVANQCFWYAGAFYFTWFALTITRILQAVQGKIYFPLLVIAAATTPMQGLPNFLVYLYPKFQKMRRENPHWGVWKWFQKSLAEDDDDITPLPDKNTESTPGGCGHATSEIQPIPEVEIESEEAAEAAADSGESDDNVAKDKSEEVVMEAEAGASAAIESDQVATEQTEKIAAEAA